MGWGECMGVCERCAWVRQVVEQRDVDWRECRSAQMIGK